MRFTEYLVEAPPVPGAQTIVQPQAERPDYSKLNTPAWKRKPDPKAQQGNPNDAAWEEIKKAATDPNTGREFITMLGAMYQTKRSNPTVQLSVPKMVTALPDAQPLKKQMMALFNIAKNDDEPHLAARSQELQQARMNAAAKPGTNVTPGQQPTGQPKPAPANTRQQRGELLKTLMKTIQDTAPKLTTRELKQASGALNAPLNAKRKKNARTKVPNAAPPAPGQPTAGTVATA